MIKFPELKKFLVDRKSNLKKVLKVINKNANGIALVVNHKLQLQGVVTDGDLRRLFIKGKKLSDIIYFYLKKKFIFINSDFEINKLKKLFEKNQHIPVLSKNKKILGLYLKSDYKHAPFSNNVIFLAGGRGKRMGQLTKALPKPMLRIKNKPIIEHQIDILKKQKFNNFVFLVNYLSNKIIDYFKNNNKFSNVNFIKEKKYLGTAGPLSLINKNKISNNFFVINGDIIAKIKFSSFLDYHIKNKNDVTICLRKYEYQIPFGVFKKNYLNLIEEKPVESHFINAGIYLFNKKILSYIKKNSYLDMNDLINSLYKKNLRVKPYFVNENIYDIGDHNQYKKIKKIFRSY
jgi:dTDP-glucose pyrophosphorylase